MRLESETRESLGCSKQSLMGHPSGNVEGQTANRKEHGRGPACGSSEENWARGKDKLFCCILCSMRTQVSLAQKVMD